MAVGLFAVLPVDDDDRALAWYGRLLGSEPGFLPDATEAAWELAEHRYVFIGVRPENAGHAMHTSGHRSQARLTPMAVPTA